MAHPIRGPKPTPDDIRRAEEAASRHLEKRFGMNLTRRDFDEALKAAIESGEILDSAPFRIPEGETREQTVLRLYASSRRDAVRAAMRVAQRAILKELDSLPSWALGATGRVTQQVKNKFRSKNLRGTKLDQEAALLVAERRAQYVFNLLESNLRDLAKEARAREDWVPDSDPGHPTDRESFMHFGVAVIRQILDRAGSKKWEEWAEPIAHLWIVSGSYPFTAGQDMLIDRAIRLAKKRLKDARKEHEELVAADSRAQQALPLEAAAPVRAARSPTPRTPA